MTDTTQPVTVRPHRYLVRNAVLSSGEPAWPLAESNGISRVAFKQRLSRGMSPDEAATIPMVQRAAKGVPKPEGTVGAKPYHLTSCGKPAVEVALAAGIPKVTFYLRLRRGWSVDQAAGLAPPLRSVGRPVT